MKKQTGFTLIELVVVVVILGLLAVTAIPRFIDLTDQAREANIEGMAGGFASAILLARAQWEADGRPDDGTDNIVSYDGTILRLTNETSVNNTTDNSANDNTTIGIRPGYVVGLTDGSNLVNFDESNCLEIWSNILQQPPIISSSITDVNNDDLNVQYFTDTITNVGVSGNDICAYYLIETLSQDTNGTFISPNGSLTVGNNFSYDPANGSVAIAINQ